MFKSYSRSGDIQSIVHAGRSSRSVLIQDNDSPESKDVTEHKSNTINQKFQKTRFLLLTLR